MAKICACADDGSVVEIERKLGALPIMVRSARCHLRGYTQRQLLERHEEAHEAGGYFICNGNERAIRLLIVPRRQHLLALVRPSFKNRGADFTDRAVQMRCVRADQTSVTVGLHYLTSGNCVVRMTIRKSEYFVPVALLLKALRPCTDRDIYARACGGDFDDAFVCDRVEAALRALRALSEPVGTQVQCLAYLGRRFRSQLGVPDAAAVSDEACGRALIDRYVLVHAPAAEAKWEVLLSMLQKLYALAAGRIAEDNADSLVNQEVLLPGHLLTMLVKERLGEVLQAAALAARKEVEPSAYALAAASAAPAGSALRRRAAPVSAHDPELLKRALERGAAQVDVGKKVDYFMATGNLVSQSGLDLQQTSGYTIVAERLNYWRFISHFRSVHRGSFFAQMRTTTVRKLLPDSWGFLCPVHTPDGSPCGLLNHLAARCELRAADGLSPAQRAALVALLEARGMLPSARGPCAPVGAPPPRGALPVLLDGELVGYAPAARAGALASALRTLKVLRAPLAADGAVLAAGRPAAGSAVTLPDSLEIVHVPAGASLQWPVLALFSGPARPLRPVKHLASGRAELIAPWEQIYMGIALSDAEARAAGDGAPGESGAAAGLDAADSHAELSPMNMLSVVASLTPFSDHNQSPRNMYQCQMGKQTMGTPYHALPYRTDNKSYRLQNPQSPLVANEGYAECCLDEYPSGCNAVVAVLAYTGYDMEDAMILNKASYERGFGHASIYSTYVIDLNDKGGRGAGAGGRHFCNIKASDEAHADGGDVEKFHKDLGEDGLPEIGQTLKQGDALYCVYDSLSKQHAVHVHKNAEPAVVEEVRLLGAEGSAATCTKCSIKLRYNRNPIPGDKFSSRHGQKGVLSRLWPAEDMPFSESGIVPDVLINPHAFPSRMTVGMLIESLAAKSGALHGLRQDGTPFRFGERQPAADHFGRQLLAAGYSHAGSEPMYSGIYGCEMQMDIYIGVVYYQRLRYKRGEGRGGGGAPRHPARANPPPRAAAAPRTGGARDGMRGMSASASGLRGEQTAREAQQYREEPISAASPLTPFSVPPRASLVWVCAGTWCPTNTRCAQRGRSTRRRASRSRGARCTAASGSARWSATRCWRTARPTCCTTGSSTARTSTARSSARAASRYSRRTCAGRRRCADEPARPRTAPRPRARSASPPSARASRAACASCVCPTSSPTWQTSSRP
jgi:DNA-directed RNA polymerase I subunit RPA2